MFRCCRGRQGRDMPDFIGFLGHPLEFADGARRPIRPDRGSPEGIGPRAKILVGRHLPWPPFKFSRFSGYQFTTSSFRLSGVIRGGFWLGCVPGCVRAWSICCGLDFAVRCWYVFGVPIRPENKARYPKDWYAISMEIRRRADNRCEECGVPNYELGGRTRHGDWRKAVPTGDNGLRLTWPEPGDYGWCEGHPEKLRIVRIVLTVAHLDHQPENCRPENLKAWCQRCHNRYDAAERRRGIQARSRGARAVADFFGCP